MESFLNENSGTTSSKQQQLFSQKLNQFAIPDSKRHQLQRWFQQYQDYRQALTAIEGEADATELYLHRWQRAQDLQFQFFDTDVRELFFDADNRYDRYMAEAMDVINDKYLNSEEKKMVISLLRNSLPWSVQKNRQDLIDHLSVSATLGLTESSPSHIGEQAQRRLQKLQTERDIWQRPPIVGGFLALEA